MCALCAQRLGGNRKETLRDAVASLYCSSRTPLTNLSKAQAKAQLVKKPTAEKPISELVPNSVYGDFEAIRDAR
jgi:hypothetical protein